MDKFLKIAKRLKTFTLEDIMMFCDVDAETAENFLKESENIKSCGNRFEYIETVKTVDKFKIIDKNIPCIDSNITVTDACEIFLNIKRKTLTEMSFQAYKTFIYSKIIPYFKKFLLRGITIQDTVVSLNLTKNKQNHES